MNKIKIFVIIVFSFITGMAGLNAQSAVLSAGGDATGSDGSVAYSVGQVAYTSYTGEDGSVSLGIQQPFLRIMVGNEDPETGIAVSISPNPAFASVNLKLDDQFLFINPESFSFGLYDIEGKLLLHQEIISPVTSISMDMFPNAVYILRVSRKNAAIKTFKIFKTN